MKKVKKNWGLGRVFWGLFFLAAAAVVVLNQAGVVLSEITALVVIAAISLLAVFLVSLRNLFWTGVFAALAGGVLLFRDQLTEATGWGDFFMSTWTVLGVALLLAIGFSILFHRRRSSFTHFGAKILDDEEFGSVDETNTTDSVVRVRTRFGETVKYIDSQNLQRVELSNSFGGQKIYFDNAKPSAKGVSVVVDNSFGGIELYVPKNWQVMDGLNSFAAGVGEKNRAILTDKSPTLRLSGNQNFAGIEIIYV